MSESAWTGERRRVPLAQWLQVIDDECLSSYVPSGGAAVRFVSGSNTALNTARQRLLEQTEARDGYVVTLDPGQFDAQGRKPDLHRIERFFFAVTADIDWRRWAGRQVRRTLTSLGVQVPDDQPLTDIAAIAADNGRDVNDLLNEYQRRVTNDLVRDTDMAYEFRAAVTALGRAQLMPDTLSPTTEEVLLAWFAGQTMPGAAAALKRIHIFQRINASNARVMLRSLCHWLPSVGHQSLVVVLDLRPYERKTRGQAQRLAAYQRRLREAVAAGASGDELAQLVMEDEDEPAVTYSDQAYRSMLALLRRFIDEIDWFERLLLIVLTTPGFYDLEAPRNYHNYDALQTRIGLEVHDAERANPSAALVHLGDPR